MCNFYRGVGLLDHRQLRDDFSKLDRNNDDHEQMYALRNTNMCVIKMYNLHWSKL